MRIETAASSTERLLLAVKDRVSSVAKGCLLVPPSTLASAVLLLYSTAYGKFQQSLNVKE
jgi:hypothetical protein